MGQKFVIGNWKMYTTADEAIVQAGISQTQSQVEAA
jgi:triosephosphate isomerase